MKSFWNLPTFKCFIFERLTRVFADKIHIFAGIALKGNYFLHYFLNTKFETKKKSTVIRFFS